MRQYRLGDVGGPVRDIQDRLLGLGLDTVPDRRGEYGAATFEAVEAFQHGRGLATDGIVGPDTWRALYEAGYRLGDRLLFLRRPMLRGEDVAELQSRFNGLGFDAGKVDGIFGRLTEQAVLDFQRNRHLPEDGKAGPEVTTQLMLVTRATLRAGRETVREREWLRSLPSTMVGARVYIDAACRSDHEAASTWEAAGAAAVNLQAHGGIPLLSRSDDVMLPERVRVQRANRLGAELIVSLVLSDNGRDEVYFFASEHSRSEAGLLLAGQIAERLQCRVAGRATPMLKETRAPAVVVSRLHLDERTGTAIVEGVEGFFRQAGGSGRS